jgi:hypothetical protein
MAKQIKCCLCGKLIPIEVSGWSLGNNAEPLVNNGRCCNECNQTRVIPARLDQVGSHTLANAFRQGHIE